MSILAGVTARLPGRQAAKDVGGVREDVKALGKSEAVLLSGDRVHGRFVQSLYWSLAAGLVIAGFPAGLYDGVLQIHWYIWIGSFHVELFYLKNWWDHLFSYNWWPLYRHAAFRDLAEPAAASMAVKTMLAGRKWWGVRVSNARVLTSPFVVLALIFGLGIIGVWLIDFSLPWAWAHVASAVGHPGFKVSAHFLGKLSVPQLALGLFVIGPVVHRYWAPVGATLQGAMLDRAVDRKQAIVQRAEIDKDRAVEIDRAGWHIIPAWVRLPLAPPVIRERFAEMWRGNAEVKVRRGHGKVIALVTVVFVLITLLGLTGHYWVGSLHHSVPYLFPEG